MDKEQYSEAAQCVQHQMDTFESLKVPLTEDYVIDNIAITIINTPSTINTNQSTTNRGKKLRHFWS